MGGTLLEEFLVRLGIDVKGSEKATNKVDALKKAALRLAAVFATGALARGVNKMINEVTLLGDQIAKTSAKIGIQAEALQFWEFAAERSGVNVRTLRMGLQRFTRRAAEAANGTGEAKDALAELGIQLTDSNGRLRSTDDLLMDVAESFGESRAQGDKLRLGFKLFDSEGAALINMFRDGKIGLQQLKAELEETGAIMGGADLEAAEAYQDSLTTLNRAFLGLKITVARDLLPSLQRFVFALREGVTWFRNILEGSRLVEATFIVLGAVAIGLAVKFAIAWGAAVLPFLLFGAAIAAAIIIVEDLYKSFVDGEGAIKTALDYWTDLYNRFTDLENIDPEENGIVTTLRVITKLMGGLVKMFTVAPRLVGAVLGSAAGGGLSGVKEMFSGGKIGGEAIGDFIGFNEADQAYRYADRAITGAARNAVGMGGNTQNNNVNVNVDVQAAPGMNERDLANNVGESVQNRLDSVLRDTAFRVDQGGLGASE